MNEFDFIHVQLSRMAEEMRQMTLAAFGGNARWRPALNAFRLRDRFLLCLDLAGVERRDISVRAEPRRLIISGTRPAPEPGHEPGEPPQALAMEIDYGPFERVIELPEEIEPEHVTATYRDGLLWVEMPLKLKPAITIPVSDENP